MPRSVAIAKVVQALGHACEHGELALGQFVEGAAPAPAVEHLGDDLGVERGAAARHLSRRFREAARLHDTVLEQVADTFGALLEQLDRVALLDVLGRTTTPVWGSSERMSAAARRSFVGVGRWHPDVGDDDIGTVLAHLVEELLRVTGLADDEEARVLEHANDTGSQRKESSATTTRRGRSAAALTCRAAGLAAACPGPAGS